MNKQVIVGIAGLILIFLFSGQMAYADNSPDKDQYVSKKQYDRLKNEMGMLKEQMNNDMSKLKEQIQILLKERSQSVSIQHSKDTLQQSSKTETDIGELQQEVKILKAQNEVLDNGTTGFLMTGYAFAGYTDSENSDSSFNAGFNPIFLWRLRDDLIFEGELEVELEDDSTNVGLEFAQLSYLLNDYVTLGAGKFLNPSNYFIERLHPAWINKLADKPITMSGDNRLQAGSQLGLQVRGGVPLGSTRGEYAFYVSNGPST